MTDLMTEKEAAAILKLSAATLRAWRCRRQGPPWVQIEGAVRYRLSDLQQYVESCLINPGNLQAA